jgi:hypothetical protein
MYILTMSDMVGRKLFQNAAAPVPADVTSRQMRRNAIHGYQKGMTRALPQFQLHSGASAVKLHRQAPEPRHFLLN